MVFISSILSLKQKQRNIFFHDIYESIGLMSNIFTNQVVFNEWECVEKFLSLEMTVYCRILLVYFFELLMQHHVSTPHYGLTERQMYQVQTEVQYSL